MTIHEFLDEHYGADGDDRLRERCTNGADLNERAGPWGEAPIHVAARRRRASAVAILLEHGAEINADNAAGKTAYAHAIRRGFDELVILLQQHGADTTLNAADQFAVAVVDGKLDEARSLLTSHPGVARTGNPEEDRLLADVAGRNAPEPVVLLLEAGADLEGRGLDDGTALHQAAWFGQPDNARLLIDAGAPLDVFESVHHASPIHWAAHGSRYSGGAAEREDLYVDVTRLLLEAGSSLHYPDEPDNPAYYDRLLHDASPKVRALLEKATRPGS